MTTATNTIVSHTPAPWHAEPAPSTSSMRSIRDANGKAVAFVNRGPFATANERLIIAAPKMLQILEGMWDSALPASMFRLPNHFRAAIEEVLREIGSTTA